MATLAPVGYPTLRDVVSSLAPDGSIEQRTANVLSKVLPLMDDAPMVEGNLPTGDQVTSVTGLPSPTWRKLNAGVPASKSVKAQFVETCGILEDYSEVDVALAKLNGNAAAFRAKEDDIKLEAYAQEVERAIIYESTLTNPEKVHGLSARYVATTGYVNSSYVLKGTNAGVNARSIWLINWDPEKVALIYPKASVAGLQRNDLGEDTIRDSSNNKFQAYVTHFVWNLGLRVKDYRHVVRFQWDPDDANFADSAKGMILAMQQMLNTIYTIGPGARFYMDRTTKTKLDAQLASNDVNMLTYLESGRGMIPAFMGTPIRKTDTLVAESAIS